MQRQLPPPPSVSALSERRPAIGYERHHADVMVERDGRMEGPWIYVVTDEERRVLATHVSFEAPTWATIAAIVDAPAANATGTVRT